MSRAARTAMRDAMTGRTMHVRNRHMREMPAVMQSMDLVPENYRAQAEASRGFPKPDRNSRNWRMAAVHRPQPYHRLHRADPR
jgi:hypothetical protein